MNTNQMSGNDYFVIIVIGFLLLIGISVWYAKLNKKREYLSKRKRYINGVFETPSEYFKRAEQEFKNKH